MYTTTNLFESIGHAKLTIEKINVTPITYQPADGSYIHECGPVVLNKRDEAIAELSRR